MNVSLFSSRESARFAWAALSYAEAANKRMIECSFRAPARYAACIVPADAWKRMAAAVNDASYKSLLDAVLDKAAKSILSARIESMSVFPSEIDDSIFSADAILNEAVGSNSEWLSKEELTQLWEKSSTRIKYVQSARYASDAHYRKAVNMFTDMILKLAGKTTSFTAEECDKILAKLSPEDMDTELGAFIVRRLEQIRNKPQRAEIDLDCL
jgi:hypothetical protein